MKTIDVDGVMALNPCWERARVTDAFEVAHLEKATALDILTSAGPWHLTTRLWVLFHPSAGFVQVDAAAEAAADCVLHGLGNSACSNEDQALVTQAIAAIRGFLSEYQTFDLEDISDLTGKLVAAGRKSKPGYNMLLAAQLLLMAVSLYYGPGINMHHFAAQYLSGALGNIRAAMTSDQDYDRETEWQTTRIRKLIEEHA